MAKFTLVCAIHAHVVQFYSGVLSELMCQTSVRLLVLYLSQSRVLHKSYTSSVLHVSKISLVKFGVLHGNETWRVQSYSTLLYYVVILVY